MNLENMTGLELLEAIVDGKLPSPSMGKTMGLQLGKVAKGYAEFHAVADHRHLNPMGGVHGGFAATVLDSVTGCAVHTVLGPGDRYGTVDLNVKLLKPVPVGKKLIATVELIHCSRTIGVSNAILKDEDGCVYASGSATCMISRKHQ
ncbi:MAG: PaaI family thioesterase [Pseudomonadota bacterium]